MGSRQEAARRVRNTEVGPGVRLHQAALDELREAVRWYGRALPGLGQEFQDEVERVLGLVAAGKLPGVQVQTPSGHKLSKVLLRRFPYSIYFEPRETTCVVWAIAHGRRRPGYWRNRG